MILHSFIVNNPVLKRRGMVLTAGIDLGQNI